MPTADTASKTYTLHDLNLGPAIDLLSSQLPLLQLLPAGCINQRRLCAHVTIHLVHAEHADSCIPAALINSCWFCQ